ncbi:hypothetical protein Tco_0651696 [Tanacetum coccineum]|uniref:Reverse transcriptase domain-containing protein n=1 Tax=Tanacetum coccineum TaxID=301880 RepID=A0ABQ4WVI8_9ASTR
MQENNQKIKERWIRCMVEVGYVVLGIGIARFLGADTPYLFSGYGILIKNKQSSNIIVLASKYAPFDILRLPQELNDVHDTFHVSNLKKCLADPTLHVPLEEIQVDAKLNFVEEPVEILEREFKKLKRSRIPIDKVRWNSKQGPEFTWERKDQMKLKYPHLFSSSTS